MISNSASEQETGLSSSSTDMSSNRQDIAVLAYQLWESRGCPEGSPETDWYLAEQEVQQSTSPLLAQAARA